MNNDTHTNYWHCLTKHGNAFVTDLTLKHKEGLSSKILEKATSSLDQFFKEFVAYSETEEGQDAEVDSTETRNEVYDYLFETLKFHNISYEIINDKFWDEHENSFKKKLNENKG